MRHPGRVNLPAALLDPIAGPLDALGRVVTLTARTLAWLVRPPFRFGHA